MVKIYINFAISRHHMFYSFHISFASPFTSWTLSASIGKAMPANIQKYHTDKVQSIVSTKSNQHHLFVFRGIIKLETHVSYDDLIKVQLHVWDMKWLKRDKKSNWRLLVYHTISCTCLFVCLIVWSFSSHSRIVH